jgi:hypothetical protein
VARAKPEEQLQVLMDVINNGLAKDAAIATEE